MDLLTIVEYVCIASLAFAVFATADYIFAWDLLDKSSDNDYGALINIMLSMFNGAKMMPIFLGYAYLLVGLPFGIAFMVFPVLIMSFTMSVVILFFALAFIAMMFINIREYFECKKH